MERLAERNHGGGHGDAWDGGGRGITATVGTVTNTNKVSDEVAHTAASSWDGNRLLWSRSWWDMEDIRRVAMVSGVRAGSKPQEGEVLSVENTACCGTTNARPTVQGYAGLQRKYNQRLRDKRLLLNQVNSTTQILELAHRRSQPWELE